jgi:hypothetical protein
MSENSKNGYILRISSDEWKKQVYTLRKYYSGVMRNWGRGTVILLAKKALEGDSFIGYGIVKKVEMLWEMTPEEEIYCIENGWKCALNFRNLVEFIKPYPLKKSPLSGDTRKGSYLHGAKLEEKLVSTILLEAEAYQKEA